MPQSRADAGAASASRCPSRSPAPSPSRAPEPGPGPDPSPAPPSDRARPWAAVLRQRAAGRRDRRPAHLPRRRDRDCCCRCTPTQAWYDGANTATCATPPTGGGRAPHPVAAADCECGFYAYGTDVAAARNRQIALRAGRRVVLGTGRRRHAGRARRARPHRRAVAQPGGARSGCGTRIAMRYPSARIYRDARRDARRAPAVARCRATSSPTAAVRGPRGSWSAFAVAVLALGLLPWRSDRRRRVRRLGRGAAAGSRLSRARRGWHGLACRARAASVGLLLFAAAWLVARCLRAGRLAAAAAGAARAARGRRRLPARAAPRLLPGRSRLASARRGVLRRSAPLGSVE